MPVESARPSGVMQGLSCDETSSASTIVRGVLERDARGGVGLRDDPHRQRILEMAVQRAREQAAAAKQRLQPLDLVGQPGHRPGVGDRRVERLDVPQHPLEREGGGLSNGRAAPRRSPAPSADQPSEKPFALTNASASLAVGSHGLRPSRSSSAAHAPSPVSAAARSASGPRSDWPSEPVVRTRGTRPALSAPTRWSASSGRTPERPRAKPATCASITARTTGSGTSGPVPVRCESSSRRLNASCSSRADRDALERADAGRQAVDALAAGEQRGR